MTGIIMTCNSYANMDLRDNLQKNSKNGVFHTIHATSSDLTISVSALYGSALNSDLGRK